MRDIGIRSAIALAWLFACSPVAQAQKAPTARIVATVGHLYSQNPPALAAGDLNISHAFKPLPVTKVTPLHGPLEIFILVDNCSNCEPGSKFNELQRFIQSQSSNTSIGVAYIQEGRLVIASNPSLDRQRTINALSPPTGSKPSNPFSALTELIDKWDRNTARRAVLVISNGINPSASDALLDSAADTAIEAAQRAGVTVYAMYHPSADYTTASYSTIYSGQVQLAHVANETGGEAYFLGYGPLPTLAPFLADIADHLANQYLVEFQTNDMAIGTFADISVECKIKELDLMVPAKVWVPGNSGKAKSPESWR